MNVVEVLERLPASLDWGVLFRAAVLRPFVSDDVLRAMYFLPGGTPLDDVAFVVLTAGGRFLARGSGGELLRVDGGGAGEAAGVQAIGADAKGAGISSEPAHVPSVAEAYAPLLAHYPVDEADCLGFGKLPGRDPVLLFARIQDGVANARALFAAEPSRHRYELLQGAGVEWLGGAPLEDRYEARFRNRLRAHVGAGALSGFARTGNCNRFFLLHGELDDALTTGLRNAAEDRLRAARAAGLQMLAKLARTTWRRPLPMTCFPPAPEAPFAYGDLVPMGFLLRALGAAGDPTTLDAAEDLRGRVAAAREGGLWAFHTGHLATATDSALVMLGARDEEGVRALDRFRTPEGAFVPQLWAKDRAFATMAESPGTSHWCQADFATTCLVRAHERALAGKESAGIGGAPRPAASEPRGDSAPEVSTPTAWLGERFHARAGLFFANPYLTDWALASALAGDEQGGGLRAALRDEILASVNEDGSFGTFDHELSTALAVLALHELGDAGGAIWRARLWLVERQDGMGLWPRSTPFYSSLRLSDAQADAARAGDGALAPGHIEVSGQVHALSVYADTYRIIGSSLALLALRVPVEPGPAALPGGEPHPRYRTASVAEYVTRFALPPYVGAA